MFLWKCHKKCIFTLKMVFINLIARNGIMQNLTIVLEGYSCSMRESIGNLTGETFSVCQVTCTGRVNV